MNFHVQHVGAGHEKTGADVGGEPNGAVILGIEREGRRIDRPERHVASENLQAVQIHHRSIIPDQLK